jgi:hypothetical protein
VLDDEVALVLAQGTYAGAPFAVVAVEQQDGVARGAAHDGAEVVGLARGGRDFGGFGQGGGDVKAD